MKNGVPKQPKRKEKVRISLQFFARKTSTMKESIMKNQLVSLLLLHMEFISICFEHTQLYTLHDYILVSQG